MYKCEGPFIFIRKPIFSASRYDPFRIDLCDYTVPITSCHRYDEHYGSVWLILLTPTLCPGNLSKFHCYIQVKYLNSDFSEAPVGAKLTCFPL